MTNIGLLPQLSGAFTVSTNSDWRDSIQFNQAAPNSASPIDLTGIAFYAFVRPSPTDNDVLLNMSTANGLLVNGNAAGTLTFAVPARRPLVAPFDNMQSLKRWPAALFIDILAVADNQVLGLFQKAGPAYLTVNYGVTW